MAIALQYTARRLAKWGIPMDGVDKGVAASGTGRLPVALGGQHLPTAVVWSDLDILNPNHPSNLANRKTMYIERIASFVDPLAPRPWSKI